MNERTSWSISILLVVGFVGVCFLGGAFVSMGVLTGLLMFGIHP